MKPGDKVVFKQDVIRRLLRSPRVTGMRGVVLAVEGAVAQVDCQGTYDSEEGETVRFIPVANLSVVIEEVKP